MALKTQIRSYIRPALVCSIRYLFGAALFFLLCSGSFAAQDAPKTVTIKLPDGSDIHFKAVYLGIDGKSFFASRKVTLGSREGSHSYKERQGDTLLSGSFVGKRNKKSDWLYYLGETEVSQGQWNSVMRWLNDKQKGKSLIAENSGNPQLPQTGATVAEIYRFIEGLNTWMLQEQSSRLPKLGNAKAFCRLPTEAEWAFAARGGIEVDQTVFNRPHPYGEKLGEYEWHRGNSGSTIRECGSNNSANTIGLKDMLGNVEELTVSLFSPEYQQGRFGQFVIRGNNYSDSSDNFDASHRTEFTSHNQNGELRHPNKVGFRLALSTSIASTGRLGSDLDKEFDKYLQTRSLTRPGLAGKASPAKQAEEDTVHYLQNQLEQIKEKDGKLNKDIDRLETLRRNDQKQYAETEQVNRKLSDANSQLEKEISKLQHILSSTPSTAELKKLKQQLIALGNKNSIITEKLKNMPAKGKPEKVFVSYENTQELSRQLKDKENELKKKEEKLREKELDIADLNRQQERYRYEVVKNAGRIREVEKRYLEALMRQAYTNAYNAYVQLVKRQEIYLPEKGAAAQKKAEKAYSQACQSLHDYWKLVVKMAEETQADLFPEVKEELSGWLQKGEKENLFSGECRTKGGQQFLSPIQRKSLNLIKRHVNQVRSGRSRLPDDLIDTFIDQPEFR